MLGTVPVGGRQLGDKTVDTAESGKTTTNEQFTNYKIYRLMKAGK